MGELGLFAEEFGVSRNRRPEGDILRAQRCTCRRGREINRRAKGWENM
jgi:hypothetical protein